MYLFQITAVIYLYYFLFNNKNIRTYYFILNNNIKQNINRMGNCFKLDKKVIVDDQIEETINKQKINHFHKKILLNKEIHSYSFIKKQKQKDENCKKLKKRICELEQQNRELEMTVLNTLKYQKYKSKTNEEVKEAYEQKIIKSYVIPDRQNNSN